MLEIERRAGEARPERVGPFRAFVGLRGFQCSAATIAWVSADSVVFAPWIGPFDGTSEFVGFTLTEDSPSVGGGRAVVVGSEPFPVRVVDLLVPPDATQIRVIGGGPMSGVNATYHGGMLWALVQVKRSPEWFGWWRQARVGSLELWYEFDPVRSGPWVRNSRNRVIAKVIRSAASTHADDPAEVGRQDVMGLMTAVARRVDQPDPPLHLLRPPVP